jgi:uncharacterized protein
VHLSKYLKAFPSRTKPDHILLYSTLRTSSALVPTTVYLAAVRGELAEPEAQTLKKLGFLVDDLEEERDRMRSCLARLNGRSRRFDAIVILNLDCNLNCAYCYEETFRSDQYMSPETATLVVERFRTVMAAGKDVYVTFYGGEPLLSQDLITGISVSLQEAARQHDVNYTFDLVTNATLLNRETALRLLPLGLKAAKFTIDGPKDIHDQQRPYSSGSGSFDTILDNMAEVCDLLTVYLGGNYYRTNYRSFPALLDRMTARGITPDKIKEVDFAPVTPKAGCAEYSTGCACINDPWLVEATLFLREEILRRGFSAKKPSAGACTVELEHNVVVNYDGTLYKCPSFLGWEQYCIGSLQGGLVDFNESHAIGNWKNEACLDCAYLPICFGGCRFLNLVQGKTMADVDCRRIFLDATLESILLQNMKYAAPAAGTVTGKQ